MKGRTPALLAAIAALAGATPALAQFTPEAGSPYPTGLAPYGAYAADFNRDGHPDVATANGDASTVSVYLRQIGGFAQEPGSPFAAGTSYAAIGDFNGDGYPDLASADFLGNGVRILLRSAGGGFAQEPPVAFAARLSAVAAGDFNNDGRIDLAVANFDNGNISVLLRNPTNDGFTIVTNVAARTNPRQLAVADFDSDGLLDIAVANEGSGDVTILRGSGGGQFGTEGAPIATGARPSGIVAADFNGDSRPDLAVSNFTANTVSVLLRNAANTGFADAPGSPIGVSAGPTGLATGDFDRSGTPDVAVAAQSGALDILRGGPGAFTRDAPTALTGTPSGVAVADFNGDAVPDAAVSSIGTNQLHILLSPTPAQPPPAPTPTPTPTPTLPPPVLDRQINVLPVAGTVRIKRRGSSRYEELKQGQQIPVGSSVDTRDGRVKIVAAPSRGKTNEAEFFDGLFKLGQSKGLTTLTLTEALDCRKNARSSASKPKTRKLWGDGKGKFRTKGKYSAATIRGTEWLVQDGCDFTRTRVKVGSVNVRDEVKKKTIILRRGKTYTARAKR